ncbi:unnamed protein product [Plutella xylostella]|uniref:(diamondback moth) hypothetical protein n=1 Tax=Plutella xylostella TaxID=51655 RepID=A0A8S4EKL1_PLUXY|nr:unnamed protein product [Plutella xylostella]
MAFATGAVLLLAATVAAAGIPASRISGGINADISDYPFVVQLERDNTGSGWSQTGGGVLINNLNFITAAHKFTDASFKGPNSFRIRAGSNKRNSGGTTYSIRTITIHPEFAEEAERDADIAVVRLTRAVEFTDLVSPAALYGGSYEVPEGSEVTVVGWGKTGPLDAKPSELLQELTLHTINYDECAARYGFGVTPNMICYGNLDSDERDSPCFGDAGGPVIYNGGVIGLISWGQSCANSYFASVGTSVPAYVDWVVDVAIAP